MGSQISQHDLKASIKLDKDQVLDNLHSNFKSTKISPKKLALHVRFHYCVIITLIGQFAPAPSVEVSGSELSIRSKNGSSIGESHSKCIALLMRAIFRDATRVATFYCCLS